jgi:hypothetical protein
MMFFILYHPKSLTFRSFSEQIQPKVEHAWYFYH